MAKDRSDRPQTPADLLAEIRDALEGKVKLRAAAPRPPSRSSPAVGRDQVHPVHSVHSVHPPRRRTALPWAIAACLLLAAGAAFLLLRPGGTARQEAKEKDDRTAKAAKIAKGEGPKTSQPAAKTEPEPDLEKELAALNAQCDVLAAKGQFGPALARLDAFAASLPRVSDPREGTSSLPKASHPSSLPKASDPTFLPKVSRPSSLPKVSHLREGIERLRSSLLSRAEDRYAALARSADAAIEKKDFPAARAALRPAESFGIPDLADRAKKKLAEIASREKSAEAWAKWDAIKADAKKLIDAAKLGEAAKLLDGAKALPLDGIAALVAEQIESIASIKSIHLKAALAAYQAESDKVWAFFKDRKYAEADKLLSALAASLPKVSDLREGIARPLQADQEAAALLKGFWAAVERGLAARKGKSISIAGAGGTLLDVQDGEVTLQAPDRAEFKRKLIQLGAKPAVAYADLEDDPPSNLLKGVFLLTEGRDLETADKALAAAGDAPALSFYKARLDRAQGREKAVAEAKPSGNGTYRVILSVVRSCGRSEGPFKGASRRYRVRSPGRGELL